ncbi:hypothetical protein [Pseudomonas syringae]|uniref:hypothetical protein n=1 Tax=Pseudomonas syringae TaxID=317 RepID=UPI0006E68F07|nr:hypothetical protein [Pseudomonas syringae]KPX94723.1 hypothetical protein ALO62_200032 [Pseudomonas amygdali pv. myricae]
MPTKKKSANATARELPSIPKELIEQCVWPWFHWSTAWVSLVDVQWALSESN